jgi:acetyl esterase/lipase
MLGPGSKTSSISKQQHMTTKDPGIKGKMWISKCEFPVPEEDDLRQAIFKAIEDMGTGQEKYTKPDAVPLTGEWTGYNPHTTDNATETPGLSEKEKYDNLMKDTMSKVTVLYFHGGAMFLLDPATYRPMASKLAKVTGGRVFSTRYRLAPQNPFPAALLDCLTAYLSLLYPPPEAPHSPIPANEVIFSGDSAGGTCCTMLLQLILQLHRTAPAGQTPKLKFHGKEVEVPLPAGLALTSPWLDVTRSLPSIEGLVEYDYLPPPSQTMKMKYPECDVWPTKPRRADMYCEGSALLHPLVSPLLAKDWSGSPPMFFSLGEEMLTDEGAVLAQRAHRQGVKVIWKEFEAMPHVFALMLDWLKESDYHYDETAVFCNAAIAGEIKESSAEYVKAKSLEKEQRDPSKLTDITEEQVVELTKKGKERIELRLKNLGEPEPRPML